MKLVPNAVSMRLGRTILVTQKNSPTILFGVGVVGVVATTVLACRATLRVDDVLTDMKFETAKAKEVRDQQPDMYGEKDLKHDLAAIRIRGAANICKLYAPAFVLGVTSVGALAGAHNILTKRNVALTAAYAAVEKGFDEYRKRVVEELGEDKDREFRYGKETSTTVVEGKNGEKKKVKREHVSSSGATMYARFFDNMNRNWDERLDYNILFLRGKQNWATDKLRAQGHLFLNEVYDDLGMDRTTAGAQVGWLYKPRDPEFSGDDYVDFGIFTDQNQDRIHDVLTGREGAILLDFNVVGTILDKI